MKKRIMLSACLMAGMVFGSPANSEVTPNPTDTDFTHNVFTLSNPQDTQPTSGSYVILAEIDKTANSWTYAPIYYDFTINTTEYGTGSPSTPYIAKIPPNENITITVNGVSNGRMDNPSSVSDKIFFGKSNGEGGAVYNSEHTTTGISNSIFVSNNSTGAGGAISNNGDETFSNTIMGDITDSIFISNSAGSSGGAIYSDGYDMYDAGVVTKMGKITGSTFISNSATYDGGAINAGGDEFSGISASTFISNSTPYDGGAIYNYVTMTNGISDSTFISNTARDGGAIYSAEGDVNITDSAFVSNTATIKGGAIYNYTYATLSIKDSAFVSNNAPRSYYGSNGGAIYNQGTISDIKNSTFISNSAGDNGGAIMYQSGTIGNIVNSTFISNSSTSGQVVLFIHLIKI